MRSILIVDDEDTILEALRAVLEQAGYSVNIARNGGEALSSILASPPDAVVSDHMMPLMDGFELCRALAINQRSKHIPFILQSSVTAVPADLPITAHLRKPCSPGRLLAILRQWAPAGDGGGVAALAGPGQSRGVAHVSDQERWAPVDSKFWP